VNRLWHHHFGRGLVATTSDFGTLGTPPSHPELLDWLAIYLVENQWSLKSIHRLILKSSTWRQSSVVTNAAAEAVDPDNQLLWRFPRRRLDAEAIRDSMLAVSGQLNSQQFGLPVFPPLPEDLADVQKVQGKNRWETQHGPEGRRRSVYIFQRRSLNVPMLDVLDSLVPNTSCAQRRSSVTSLQALELYNGAFTNQMAVSFAERVRSEAGADYDDQIRRAFVTALCRLPSDDELNQFRTLAQKNVSERGSTELSGMVRVCRVLLNCNEFLYPD
jgi:hypothetical protein